jgi:Ca2+-binding RTX toxin-like protein
MAKFKLEKDIGELMLFHYNYDSASMEVMSQSSTKIEVADNNGDKVVYTGAGLAIEGDEPTGGKVKKIEFFDSDGDLLLTISDGTFKLTDILITEVQLNFNLFEAGNDTFTGSSVGDVIMYGNNLGNDKIFGLGGNDYIQGSDGKNMYDGGKGDEDVLTWSNVTYEAGMKGVKVDLVKGEAVNPWGKDDTITGIEDVRGTKFADTFVGSNRDEQFDGLGGNDTFTGGKGVDRFEFGFGMGKDKILDFGNGNDLVALGIGIDDFKELKAMMDQKGKNTVIDFGEGDILTFVNVNKGDFAKGDFIIYEF